MIKVVLIIMNIWLILACSTNASLELENNEYMKYKKNFFKHIPYINKSIKYYEGSYSEGQSNSFEPSKPSGHMTEYEALKRGSYFKVIYSDRKPMEGIGITDGRRDITFFYDNKGRIIKKYYHENDAFSIKNYNQNSLDEIYCNEYQICLKKHLTREEDEMQYKSY